MSIRERLKLRMTLGFWPERLEELLFTELSRTVERSFGRENITFGLGMSSPSLA